MVDVQPPLKEWQRAKYRKLYEASHGEGLVAVLIRPWDTSLDDIMRELAGSQLVHMGLGGYSMFPKAQLDELVERFGPEARRLTVRRLIP